MANTYSAPGESDKDTVRFLLQDTRDGEWLLSDEEITYSITQWKDRYGTLEYVAAQLAETIAARYAREASYSADGVSIGLGQVAQQFRDLALSLRETHKNLLSGGLPDVGGITPGEQHYPGTKNFAFGTGMHDDLEAGQQDWGSRDGAFLYPEEYPGQ